MKTVSANDHIISINIEQIKPGKYQPRKTFSENKLSELALSIKSQGIIQPLTLRKLNAKIPYEIIAGERRWRAAKIAGLKEVPAIIKIINDHDAIEIALIENVQRENLNPIEEAITCKRLIDEFSLTHQDIAKRVGKSRSHITNKLRLLTLPNEVKELILEDLLSFGHARVLVNVETSKQAELAKKIINDDWSVRKTEEAIRAINNKKNKIDQTINLKQKKKRANTSSNVSKEIDTLKNNLAEIVGLPIEIKDSGNYQGALSIEYSSFQELEQILFFFTKQP